MNILQRKYISLISSRLERYKQVNSAGSLFNFRCPYCLDSEKSASKARGYFYDRENQFWFFCHNCSKSTHFEVVLKDLDHNLYKEYFLELFTETKPGGAPSKTVFVAKTSFFEYPDLLFIQDLPETHNAKQYLRKRQIPEAYINKLYYVNEFKKFTNFHIPNKFESVDRDEGRVIIPFVDQNGAVFGYQGRSLTPDAKIRYITIMMREDRPKIFGLDLVDFNRTFYVTEGPFDSMFVQNAIATCGGDLIADVRTLNVDHARAVIVYDNQPRNGPVVANIQKAINAGFKVVIWPETIREKDINDQILNRTTTSELMTCLAENTFSGLEALLKLEDWKKV